MVGPIYDDYVAESPDMVLLQNDDREKEKKHTLISRILGFVAMGLSLIGMLVLFATLFEVTILSKFTIALRHIFEIKDLMDAYVVGAEQSYPRRGGQPPQPKEDTLSSTYLRIIVARC